MLTQTQTHLAEEDVAAAEAEMLEKEQAVEAEAERLNGLRRQTSEHVMRARQEAKGPALAATLGALKVPSVSLRTQLEKARLARVKAVGVRKACAEAALKTLKAHEAELRRVLDCVRDEEQGAKQRQLEEQEESLAATMIRAIETATLQVPKPTLDERRPAPAAAQRRVTPRASLCAEISLGSDSNFFTGFTNDVSEGGVFVATVNLMPLGTQIDLAFSLPGGPRIEGKGEVRWVREFDEKNPETFPGMGIRFTDIPLPSVQAIHAFTEQREPMFFPEN